MLNFRQRAFKALKEALKANHGSWQVWENYLFVCSHLISSAFCLNFFINFLMMTSVRTWLTDSNKESSNEIIKRTEHETNTDLRDDIKRSTEMQNNLVGIQNGLARIQFTTKVHVAICLKG